MCDTVEHVTEVAKKITGKVDKFTDGFQESTDQLAQATHELTEKTTEMTEMRMTPTIPAQAPATYTTIVQQTNLDHAEIVARTETMDKQILIQKDKNTADNTLTSLSELDLVTKANTALDLMGWEGLDQPRNTTFIAAKKL